MTFECHLLAGRTGAVRHNDPACYGPDPNERNILGYDLAVGFKHKVIDSGPQLATGVVTNGVQLPTFIGHKRVNSGIIIPVIEGNAFKNKFSVLICNNVLRLYTPKKCNFNNALCRGNPVGFINRPFNGAHRLKADGYR